MKGEGIFDEDGTLLATVVRKDPFHQGVEFFTAPDCPLQVGKVQYPKGHVIPKHFHNPIPRASTGTVEVLLVLRGAARVEVAGIGWLVPHADLTAGDLIIIYQGTTHRIEMPDDTILLEIKTGPYVDRTTDKTILEK